MVGGDECCVVVEGGWSGEVWRVERGGGVVGIS